MLSQVSSKGIQVGEAAVEEEHWKNQLSSVFRRVNMMLQEILKTHFEERVQVIETLVYQLKTENDCLKVKLKAGEKREEKLVKAQTLLSEFASVLRKEINSREINLALLHLYFWVDTSTGKLNYGLSLCGTALIILACLLFITYLLL